MFQDLPRRGAIAASIGAAIGILWWWLYVPHAHPLGLLVLSHAGLALAIERVLWLVGMRSVGALVGAVGMVLFVAPIWLNPLYAIGWLGSPEVFFVLPGMFLITGLGGAWLGGLVSGRGGSRVAGGFGELLVVASLVAASTLATTDGDAPQPRALHVTPSFPEQRVLVFGIDGGDWQVLDPLIERGLVPHLARLRSEGRWGTLQSTEPTMSPVVWTTILSGQTPDVHGLVDWHRSDARNRRVPMLWDIFGAHDRSSLTVNVPGSWPPAEVANGTMLAGFPIPGLTTGTTGQLVGAVATTNTNSTGSVQTLHIETLGDGRFRLEAPLAAAQIEPRLAGITNVFLDTLVRKQRLQLRSHRLILSAERLEDGRVRLEGEGLGDAIVLSPETWSPWLRYSRDGVEAIFQLHLLDSAPTELSLYLTPGFQAPVTPRFPFATGLGDPSILAGSPPYVVEGLGWRAHRDDRIAELVPGSLFSVERGHARVTEALIGQGQPDLVSYIFTASDRIQHGFWREHEPDTYVPIWSRRPGLESRDPVVEAYILADAVLGALLERLADDTLVFVVSDHGATPHVEKGEGTHRNDGIWIARGPGVAAASEPIAMGIEDVTPTVLHCMGAPVALDFARRAVQAVCPGVARMEAVASYREAGGAVVVAQEVEIDEARRAQLTALGYLDADGEAP